MNKTAKALLKDLQSDLDKINTITSTNEVVWQLEKLKRNIDVTKKLILESI